MNVLASGCGLGSSWQSCCFQRQFQIKVNLVNPDFLQKMFRYTIFSPDFSMALIKPLSLNSKWVKNIEQLTREHKTSII